MKGVSKTPMRQRPSPRVRILSNQNIFFTPNPLLGHSRGKYNKESIPMQYRRDLHMIKIQNKLKEMYADNILKIENLTPKKQISPPLSQRGLS